MNYNIVQEFLINKRNFELQEQPIVHYRKRFNLVDKLTIDYIIVFKDYDITFGKYLYYDNSYCCVPLANEQTFNCKNVNELFDLVKRFDIIPATDSVKKVLNPYYITTKDKLLKLQQENQGLREKVTASQRAVSMFGRNTDEHKGLSRKLSITQNKLTRNQKEIEILTDVVKVMQSYLSAN